MPVWGAWDGEALWFSSGRRSRKVRNLAADPRCVVTTDDPKDPVVVEGSAELVVRPRHDRACRGRHEREVREHLGRLPGRARADPRPADVGVRDHPRRLLWIADAVDVLSLLVYGMTNVASKPSPTRSSTRESRSRPGCPTSGSRRSATGSPSAAIPLRTLTREEECFGYAAGYRAAGGMPLVLLQCSGLGNAINAIGSLVVPYGLGFPVVLSMRGTLGERNPSQMPLGPRDRRHARAARRAGVLARRRRTA